MLTKLQVWSEDKELLGCGCYDNAVARIIPRITSKVTTQMRMNITFCKKRDRSLQCREKASTVPMMRHCISAGCNICPSLGNMLQVRQERTENHLWRQGPAVWSSFMKEGKNVYVCCICACMRVLYRHYSKWPADPRQRLKPALWGLSKKRPWAPTKE